jgi:endonuclease/exonuclease/phosphatase family protein
MALARKAPRVLALDPDLVVVQECASSAELDGLVRVGWAGRSTSKGLGVFARPSLGAAIAAEFWDPTREWFLPVRLNTSKLNILAAWAMHHRGLEDRPKKWRLHAAMEHYRDFLSTGHSLLIGDLNDNVTWDTAGYPSFTTLSTLLGTMGLTNLYHARTGEPAGSESRGSFYFYRRAERPYLIDHAYWPASQLPRVLQFSVGEPEDWLDVSDHTPLILDLSAYE